MTKQTYFKNMQKSKFFKMCFETKQESKTLQTSNVKADLLTS